MENGQQMQYLQEPMSGTQVIKTGGSTLQNEYPIKSNSVTHSTPIVAKSLAHGQASARRKIAQ